jgi:hypothetical protein
MGMANDGHTEGDHGKWLDDGTIAIKQSSIRLIYSFQADPSVLMRVRSACANNPNQWKDVRISALGEGSLTGHAAELLEQLHDDAPLAVYEFVRSRREKADPCWPSNANWSVGNRNDLRAVELNFETPQLWLFDIGLGYVVFDAKVGGTKASDWLSALHHLRHLSPRRKSRPLEFDLPVTTQVDGLRGLIHRLLESLLPSLPAWWQPIDMKEQLRSFAALYVNRSSMSPVETEFERRFLYQVCELAPPDRPFALPAETEKDYLRGEHYCYARGAHFVASREGCAFVALDADLDQPFWSETMPNHLRRLYFVTYLLTHYQRQAIETLRRRVSRAGRDQDISPVEWRDIQRLSASVKSHGYFVEVAQSNNHARFERMVRGLAQVDRLFELTTKAVDEITGLKLEEHERHKAEAQRVHARTMAHKQRLWTIGGAAVAFASLALTFLNVNISSLTDGEGMQLWLVLALALGFAIFGGVVGYCLAPMKGDKEQGPSS